MLVWEEVEELLPSKDVAPEAPLSKESYRALFEAVVAEADAGTVVHTQKLLMAIGQNKTAG